MLTKTWNELSTTVAQDLDKVHFELHDLEGIKTLLVVNGSSIDVSVELHSLVHFDEDDNAIEWLKAVDGDLDVIEKSKTVNYQVQGYEMMDLANSWYNKVRFTADGYQGRLILSYSVFGREEVIFKSQRLDI